MSVIVPPSAGVIAFRGEHLPTGPEFRKRRMKSTAVLLYRAMIDGYNWTTGIGKFNNIIAMGEDGFVHRHGKMLREEGLTTDEIRKVYVAMRQQFEDAKSDFDRVRKEARDRGSLKRK